MEKNQKQNSREMINKGDFSLHTVQNADASSKSRVLLSDSQSAPSLFATNHMHTLHCAHQFVFGAVPSGILNTMLDC